MGASRRDDEDAYDDDRHDVGAMLRELRARAGGNGNGIGVVGIECSLVTVRDRAEARRSGRPPPPMEWTYCHPRHQGLGEN